MTDWTLDYKDQTGDSGELRYLDPAKLIFSKRGDVLVVTIEDQCSYLKVHAVRAFPLTFPHEFIGLLDAISGKEIGMLRTLKELDHEARQLVQESLDKRYFVPKITRILGAKREFGTVYWSVETDRGPRRFMMRGIRDSIHEVQPGRYLVVDIDGNRFEIPSLDKLDSRSQNWWERLV